jgi:hypothetical protein
MTPRALLLSSRKAAAIFCVGDHIERSVAIAEFGNGIGFDSFPGLLDLFDWNFDEWGADVGAEDNGFAVDHQRYECSHGGVVFAFSVSGVVDLDCDTFVGISEGEIEFSECGGGLGVAESGDEQFVFEEGDIGDGLGAAILGAATFSDDLIFGGICEDNFREVDILEGEYGDLATSVDLHDCWFVVGCDGDERGTGSGVDGKIIDGDGFCREFAAENLGRLSMLMEAVEGSPCVFPVAMAKTVADLASPTKRMSAGPKASVVADLSSGVPGLRPLTSPAMAEAEMASPARIAVAPEKHLCIRLLPGLSRAEWAVTVQVFGLMELNQNRLSVENQTMRGLNGFALAGLWPIP